MLTTQFDPLPRETHIRIFEFLPFAAIFNISVVCRLWKEFAEENSIWESMAARQWDNCKNDFYASWKKYFYVNFTYNSANTLISSNHRLFYATNRKLYIEKHKELTHETDHQAPITCLQLQETPQDEYPNIVTASADSTMKIWKYNLNIPKKPTLSCHQTLVGHCNPISSLLVTNKWIISGSVDHTIKVWKANSEKGIFNPIFNLEAHKGAVSALQFGVDNQEEGLIFYSGSFDKTIRVWKIFTNETIECLKVIEGVGEITCMTSPGSNNFLYTGSKDKIIRIWEKTANHHLVFCGTVGEHASCITALQTIPALPLIFSGSDDGNIRIWKIDEKTKNWRWETQISDPFRAISQIAIVYTQRVNYATYHIRFNNEAMTNKNTMI